MQRLLRGFSAQLLLVTLLPLTLVLSAVSFGALAAHQQAMRTMVGERDNRAIVATAIVLSDALRACAAPAGIPSAERARTCLTSATLEALVNPMGGQHRVDAYVFDRSGTVILHTNPARVGANVAAHAGVFSALDGQEGTVYQNDPVSGEEHVVSFARLRLPPGSEPLGVILEEPWEAVLDPMMRFSLAAPLVLLPMALLTALAITLGLRRIVRPLQQLQAAAQRVEEGDLDALARGPHRDGIQEIKDLGATLEKMAARIQTDQRSLRAHAQAVMRAQESERARLAHELHDDTIQNLVALAQRAQLLKAMLPAEAPAQARLGELRDHAQRMIDDVRRISRGLRPIYLEEAGLMSALERLALETDELSAQRSPPVRVSFECAGDITRQEPEVELALFRVAQEAIANALRHADARRVQVELSGTPEALTLTVADDGRGFDVSQPGNPDGLGIFSIRERANAIGATVEVSSAPGAGARVRVALGLGRSSG